MPESTICPVWDNTNRRFNSRRYQAWDHKCGSCGRKVVVSEAVKRRIDGGETVPIICEQCGLTPPYEPFTTTPRWQSRKGCMLCVTLQKQLNQAQLEMYAHVNSKDRKAEQKARRKWVHLADALAHHDHRETN
jgi:hypothetical protein